MSQDIYREEILDNYQHPKNKGKLAKASSTASVYNTLCGDFIKVELMVKDDVVKDIRFDGDGCAISQAAASMLTEKVKGMSVKKVASLKKDDVLKLLKISLSPTRLRCGLLALDAIQQAIKRQ